MDPLFSRLLDPIYRLCIWAAGVAIFCMSLIIPWGVFARYVLGSGSAWPEPIAIMLMVIFTFLGGAAAYRAGSHIAVQLLVGQLPPALRKVSALFIDLVMLGVCGFVVVWGTDLSIFTWGQSIDTLPWLPVGATYAALPLGSLFTALFVVERIFLGSQAHRPLVAFGEVGGSTEEGAI